MRPARSGQADRDMGNALITLQIAVCWVRGGPFIDDGMGEGESDTLSSDDHQGNRFGKLVVVLGSG